MKRDQAWKQNKGELSRVNFPQNSRQQNKQQQQKKACKKKAEDDRVDFKTTTSIHQQAQSEQELARRGKGKGTPQEKGEAYKPLPQQQRGEGEQLLPNKAQRACTEKPLDGKGKDKKSNPRAGACTDKLHQKEGKSHQTTPSFRKELTNNKELCGATSAERRAMMPKLAGGKATSKHRSTYRQLGREDKTRTKNLSSTKGTNLLLHGWFPTRDS